MRVQVKCEKAHLWVYLDGYIGFIPRLQPGIPLFAVQ